MQLSRYRVLVVLFSLSSLLACRREATIGENVKTSEEPIGELPPPVRVEGVGLRTPESVLHDERADVYLVSNINGEPLARDDNGFIARLGPDGAVIELEWISGAAEGVTLHAPKGMALSGQTLYVADIDTVRTFDRSSGAPTGSIEIAGARFLNDVVAGQGGQIYVTDTGSLNGTNGTNGANGTNGPPDAIYRIGIDNSVEKLAQSSGIGKPNGIAIRGGDLFVVTAGSNEIYTIDVEGYRESIIKVPAGGLDGIVLLRDGRAVVSSWEAGAIFVQQPDGTFRQLLSGIEGPADMGYDAKRDRLLVPAFLEDAVLIQPLSSAPVSASE